MVDTYLSCEYFYGLENKKNDEKKINLGTKITDFSYSLKQIILDNSVVII